MATIKKGTLAKPRQWWKHMKDYKKVFWHEERQKIKRDIKKQIEGGFI
jgi:hypothetical protein